MCKYKKLILLFSALSTGFYSIAQTTAAAVPEKQDAMRSGGKIYVVMTIVITILTGLIIYVARLDKKLTRLEKGVKE